MTLVKSKLTAVLLALTLAGPVVATTGPTITAYSASPSLITATGTFQHNVASAFDDYVHFGVGPNGGFAWTAFAFATTGFTGLTSFSSDLFAGTWSSDVGLPPSVTAGLGGFVPFPSPAFTMLGTGWGTVTAFAPGDYTLRLQGTVEPLGGSYAGTITLSPASVLAIPVSEPGEWALMLSGIGLIGLMVGYRRRTGNPTGFLRI